MSSQTSYSLRTRKAPSRSSAKSPKCTNQEVEVFQSSAVEGEEMTTTHDSIENSSYDEPVVKDIDSDSVNRDGHGSSKSDVLHATSVFLEDKVLPSMKFKRRVLVVGDAAHHDT